MTIPAISPISPTGYMPAIFDLGQLASRAQTSAGDQCMTDHGTFGDRVAGEPSRQAKRNRSS